MKSRIRRTCLRVIMPLLLLLVPMVMGRPAAAAEPLHPVAVLSVAGADKLLNDFAYLTRVAGRAEVGGIAQVMSAELLKEVDRTKPSGVYMVLVDRQPQGVGFVPIKNIDALLTKLKDRFSFEPERLDGGILRFGHETSVYLRQVGPWLFFSDHARYLQTVPEDPSILLAELYTKYDVALQADLQNVPKPLRDEAVKRLTSGIRAALDPALPENADLAPDVAQELQATLSTIVTQLVQKTDQLTLGWLVDPQQKMLRIEMLVTAVDGSLLAQQLRSLADAKTVFPGVLQTEAAMVAHSTFRLSSQDVAQLATLVQLFKKQGIREIERDPNAPPQLRALFAKFVDVIDKTVAEGNVDAAGALRLTPHAMQFIGAARTADGAALDTALREIYALAKSEPDVPEITFDATTFKDVHFHTLRVPIPEQEADTRRALGDKLDVVIGTSDKAVYLAFGRDAAQLLKEAVSKSADAGPQEVPAFRLRVAVKPILQFLANVNTSDEHLTALAAAAQQVTASDQLSLTVDAIDNGARCRIDIDEGVLAILGAAAKVGQQKATANQ